MNRRFIPAVAAIFALAVAAPAFAQTGDTNPPPPSHQWGGRGPGPGGFAFGGFAMGFGGKTVTGAPFSAGVTITHNQKLSDGNSVANTSNGTVARDSQGRTRREMTLPEIGPLSSSGQTPHLAFIGDPTTGTNFTLNMNKKTAQQFTHNFRGANGATAGNGAHGRGMRGGNGNGANFRANTTTQSLGTKTVNGVNAEGTLITHTIPAGAMGNSDAIVTTTERWYSSDLHMVVSETRTDPRFGTTTMQLTNINRGEPDASLFAVPQDFTVTQGNGRMGRHRPGPGSNQ